MKNYLKNKKDNELADLLSILHIKKLSNYNEPSFFDILLKSFDNILVSENPDFVINQGDYLFNIEHFRIDNSHKKSQSIYQENLSKIRDNNETLENNQNSEYKLMFHSTIYQHFESFRYSLEKHYAKIQNYKQTNQQNIKSYNLFLIVDESINIEIINKKTKELSTYFILHDLRTKLLIKSKSKLNGIIYLFKSHPHQSVWLFDFEKIDWNKYATINYSDYEFTQIAYNVMFF